MGILTLCGGFMAMQFEKHGDLYLYRVNGKGPARPATEAEYRRFVRRAGVSFVSSVAALLLSIVAAAMLISLWFPSGDEPGGMVLLGIALVGIGFAIYRAQYRMMRTPERALAGRTPVDVPTRTGRVLRRMPQTPKPKPKGGTLAWFGFLFAEFVGGVSAFIAGVALLRGWGDVAGIVGGLIAGGAVVWWLDRWCERHTGSSAIDWMPTLP